MRIRFTVLVALLALTSGCLGSEPTNPNLLAPKVVLDMLPDGDIALFVHSAFGERRYDSITLALDNETIDTRSQAFSLEHRMNQTQFFLDVSARSGESEFRLRGAFDLNTTATQPRIDVSLLDSRTGWADERTYGLPFERILDRPEVTA